MRYAHLCHEIYGLRAVLDQKRGKGVLKFSQARALALHHSSNITAEGGCATRAWKLFAGEGACAPRKSLDLKSVFQNRLVSESGFVKMYHFASFPREIFVDCRSLFRLYFVLRDRERHRRGDPERPAPLWTVAYRLGPSFRGL